MEYEIKRINFWSVIKFLFVVFFLIGACCGLSYVLILSILNNVLQSLSGEIVASELAYFSGISIFGQVIFFSISISFFGCFLGALFICTYNLLSHLFGGIKIELASMPNNGFTMDTTSNNTDTNAIQM